jgi:hypothetical protein
MTTATDATVYLDENLRLVIRLPSIATPPIPAEVSEDADDSSHVR